MATIEKMIYHHGKLFVDEFLRKIKHLQMKNHIFHIWYQTSKKCKTEEDDL